MEIPPTRTGGILMKAAIRNIVARTYKPVLEKYLSGTRTYRRGELRLRIPPGVFHPRFFFSTQLLLKEVEQLSLPGKTFLEPGCGSGLISMVAARLGACVTAVDINPTAVQALQSNCASNKVELTVIESDLFREVPAQAFDIIAINPPYYRKKPTTAASYAWCCGEKGEYFEKLFRDLPAYTHASSIMLIVLFEGCDMEMIHDYAARNGFSLDCIHTSRNILETNFIFRITYSHAQQ